MANEFIIKNGYFSQGNSNITGSLTVTGGITASLLGTASNALTASNSLTASYVNTLTQNVIITGSLTVGSGSRTLITSINTGSNTFILNSSANLGLNAGPSAGIAFTVNNGAAAMYITSIGQTLIGNPRVNPIESGSATLHVTNVGTQNSFLVEDSANPDTTPFIIDNAGNVAIGTLTSSAKLTVVTSTSPSYPTTSGTSQTGYYSRLRNNLSNLVLDMGGNGAFGNWLQSTNQTDLSLTYPLLLNPNGGTVSIGTTESLANLHVSGSVYATSFTGSLFGTTSNALTASYINPLTQNVIVTGSLTVTNDFTVLGSASIVYITSSQLNIADNIITVNTINPSIRFGGLAVADSGSSPIQSGSMLFDSQENQWIFVHQGAGAVVTSSLLLVAAETYNNIGGETHPTTNRVMKSLNDEHIGDSNITDTGTVVSINSNTEITGSLGVTGGVTASLQGTASYATTALTASYVNPLTQNVIITGSLSQGIGNQTNNTDSHAAGYYATASGLYSHAEGHGTIASGTYSHAEGEYTTALRDGSHAEGVGTVTSGSFSHAEGINTKASGSYSHAEGSLTRAIGESSHAEGESTRASGSWSHAEGSNTLALGSYSHAEGTGTIASGSYSHAEGDSSIARGAYSHAEGSGNLAAGDYSHAEGEGNKAYGQSSHAEGYGTITHGSYSHAEGLYTVASGSFQLVVGQYNISSSAQSAFIVGNGTIDGSRSNLIFASGSTVEITGSLAVSGSVIGQSGNTISSDALVQASLLYLSNNF